ncbi:MAG TPA: pyridoxamine 5'-phosphate oxidase family protein [Bacteroidales bacterium]|nr:pyridoxamine 5'-phosphate oxidase family protein [Bacteroidales bacterium]
MKEVHDFLRTCGVYYLATVDDDQPRVRPFGTAVIFEQKLYIQTGRKKNVARQMLTNPKVEICAYDPGKGIWLRIEAIVVADERLEAKQYVLDQYPQLKSMYRADDDNTLVLYLKDATATFYSFANLPRTVNF